MSDLIGCICDRLKKLSGVFSEKWKAQGDIKQRDVNLKLHFAPLWFRACKRLVPTLSKLTLYYPQAIHCYASYSIKLTTILLHGTRWPCVTNIILMSCRPLIITIYQFRLEVCFRRIRNNVFNFRIKISKSDKLNHNFQIRNFWYI